MGTDVQPCSWRAARCPNCRARAIDVYRDMTRDFEPRALNNLSADMCARTGWIWPNKPCRPR